MTASRSFAFLVGGLLLAVSPAYADSLPETVLRLKPDATVRVEFLSLNRIEGRFLHATTDTLFLSADSAEVSAPLQDIHGMWQRGRATKTGALIGGVVGGIGLAFIAALLESVDEDPNNDEGTVRVFLY